MTTAPRLAAPAAAIDAAAQAYVDGLALRDSLSPEDAARAAGARTPAEVERIAGLIRAQRSGTGGQRPVQSPVPATRTA